MTSGEKVFVSYARSDTAAAIKIATELKKAGAKLWLDQLDIRAGAIWDVEIEQALQSCQCLLFIVSKASVASNNVLNEVYYAVEDNKRVLPVKIDDCKIPFRIKRLHYVDLSTNYEEGFKQLLNNLDLEPITTTAEPVAEVKENASHDDGDRELWEEAERVDTISSYDNYLSAYPNGRFKTIAERNKKRIERERTEADSIKREEQLWQEACAKDDVESYKNYLQYSVKKLYVQEAEAAINKLTLIQETETEEKAWAEVERVKSYSAYNHYLHNYPNGKYSKQAREEINRHELEEETLWAEAKNINTAEHFKKYLVQSSILKYKEEANKALNELSTAREEELLWQKATQQNSTDLFHEYLDKYPEGMHFKEAVEAINKANEVEEEKVNQVENEENKVPEDRQGFEGNKSNTPAANGILIGVGVVIFLFFIYLISTNSKSDYYDSSADSASYTSSDTSMTVDTTGTETSFTTDSPAVGTGTAYIPSDTSVNGTELAETYFEKGKSYDSKGKYVEGNRWFEKAIALGHVRAAFYLGVNYRIGLGVSSDPATALKLFMRAAAAGHSDSMNQIKEMYENGEGVERDLDKAREWKEKAQAAGYVYK